jgi:hypothetical protein
VRWLYAFVILAACRSGNSDGPSIDVFALAGEVQPEAGALVLATNVDGAPIDQQTTAGDGHAAVEYEAGELVTIEFVRTSVTQLITTPAPATGMLAIHGPIADRAPIIAGALAITAPPITADTFVIDLGCTHIVLTSLPATVNILATCFGTDSKIDVLVRALQDGNLVAYSGARVPVVDEVGMLDISDWTMLSDTSIPIAQNDVSATITLDEVADGFVFPSIMGTEVWTGLVSDQTRVHAVAANTTTTQFTAGLPTSIAFAATDFLPAATSHLTRAQSTFSWPAFGVGDLINLHAVWAAYTWDTVLPPDAATISFPDPNIAMPADGVMTSLRAIDGPDTASFDEVQAAGIRIQGPTDATIVPPPTAGEVKETTAL